MDIKGNFAANLRTIRLTKGLSLLEFADEIGISKSTLYKIEKGETLRFLLLIKSLITCRSPLPNFYWNLLTPLLSLL